MREYDDIERLFSDTFSEEKAIPPRKVKSNLDETLFPDSSRGAWTILRHYMWLLPLLFLLTTSAIYMVNDDDLANQELSLSMMDSKTDDITKDIRLGSSDESNVNSNIILNSDAAENVILDEDFSTKTKAKSSTSEGADLRQSSKAAVVKAADKKVVDSKKSTDMTQSSKVGDHTNPGDLESLGEKSSDKVNEISEKKDGEDEDLVMNKMAYQKLGLLNTTGDSPQWMNNKALNYQKEKNNIPLEINAYFGFNSGITKYRLKDPNSTETIPNYRESIGTEFSLEIATPLSERLSIATGFAYNGTTSEFHETTSTIESVYIGDEMLIIEGPTFPQDSSDVDTTYIPQFEEQTIEELQSTFVRTSVFSLPIYLQTNLGLGKRFDLKMSLGALLSYNRYTILTNELNMENYFKSFSANLVFRPELCYRIGGVGVSIYGKVGYDIRNGFTNEVNRLSRFHYGSGISLKYNF